MSSQHKSDETPCQPRTTDSVNNNIGSVTLEQYRRQSTIDLATRSVRANSVEEFLDRLMPFRPGRNADFQRPILEENPFKELEHADKMLEARVVELFIDAVNSKGLTPGLVMASCEKKADPKNLDETGQKIDAGFFPADRAPDDGRPHWADQAGGAEFKTSKEGYKKYDPFSDEENNPEPTSDDATHSRGQAMTFAELPYAMQQRVSLFMLYVIGRRFRLLRWDRAGVIFSPLVDYVEHPEPLLEFLWRLSHLGDTARGLDPSTTRLSYEGRDWKTMDRVARDTRNDFDHEERDLDVNEVVPEKFTWKYIREMFAESIADPDWPRYKLFVNVAPKTTRGFLVGKPVMREDGLVGPGTRWYVAFDCEEGRFVWLKDFWRATYELVETEGEILACLNSAQVENVPTLVCHGDVRKQMTLTAQWWQAKHPMKATPALAAHQPRHRARGKADGESASESDVQTLPDAGFREDCPVRQLTHYRIVTEEVCMLLDKFVDGNQLVSVLLDCLNAHRNAMKNPSHGRLHRNITNRCTLIRAKVVEDDAGQKSVQWRGILANWELSKAVAENSVARQPDRNGSWQFMSVNLLSINPARFSIADDLESLVLVLIYYAVRYLSSSIEENHRVAAFLDRCFDSYTLYRGKFLCGERKADIMKEYGRLIHYSPGEGRKAVFFESPLDDLLATILNWFRLHYKMLTWKAQIKLNPSLARAQEHFHTPAKPPRSHPSNGCIGPDRPVGGKAGESKLEPPPTSDEKDLALRVLAHSFIIDEFSEVVDCALWSGNDRHPDGDRVPEGWSSLLDPVPECSPSSETA